MPVSYYEQLKTNLNADAAAKKAALDAAYEAYTQAQFNESGDVSYKTPGRLGTRDVQYDTEKRNVRASGEAGGTLRSGQQARNLATSMASYKADVLGRQGQLTADKSAVDTATASKLAEYEAMYKVPGASTSTTPSNKTDTKTDTKIEPTPTFQNTKPTTTQQKSATRKIAEYTPPKKTVTPKKILPPNRIGGL